MMIKQIDLAVPYFQTNTIGVWHGPILRHTQVINPSVGVDRFNVWTKPKV